jgi:PAS domain S-box-containing protein
MQKANTLILTPDGRIAFASTYFGDLVGMKPPEVAGMSWFDFVFPEDLQTASELFEAAKLPHADPIRLPLRRHDGSAVWTDIQTTHLQTPGGRTYAVTATITAANGGSLNTGMVDGVLKSGQECAEDDFR